MVKKITIIVSVILVLLFLILLPFLIKVQIECISQDGPCPDEVNARLEVLKAKSLFSARSGISKTLKKDPMVTEFSTQFKLPNVLLVSIIAKKPIFAIKDRVSGKYYLISKDGVILSTTDSSNLPTVEQDGSTPNLFALNVVLGVYQMYQVLYGVITNDTLVVDMKDGFRVIFPLEGDTQVLLGSLRLIYTKIETSGNPNGYKQVDLRFVNPVLI
jgi:hypothetical protein